MAPTDTELVQQAQRGDMASFEQLVQRYDDRVLSIAATYSNNADDAKDIYQEVFIRAYRGLKKFQFRSEFSTWLYRIATNACLSYTTRQKKRVTVPIDGDDRDDDQPALSEVLSDGATTDQQAINSEIAFHVHNALNALSPQQRLVFTLRHYEGYKLREISEMMDCAEGTVKKYLFTATDRMRKQLQGIYG
jgi:RNA polymerase sigma-70 factor (ECF subfamily)